MDVLFHMLLPKSMDHVAQARSLLETGDAKKTRYATLETRMAIETVFYALLEQYRDELPSDITKRWQPRQVIDAVLSCNPMAQQYQQLTIRPHVGEAALFTGNQSPVPPDLLRKHYHKLGNYLHAPVDGVERDLAGLRASLEDALASVERYCRETTMLHNGGIFLQHSCICGRIIKRNLLAAGMTGYAQCPDENCQAVFDIKIITGGARWALRLADMACRRCRVKTPIGVHKLQEGSGYTCIGCGLRYRIRLRAVAEIEEPPAAGEEV
jgi:hypothetical protein